tara:strand:+ start:806 stop:1132 length:327 start_codon:yes stop_codon:yes gene_type:complete
MPGHFKESSSWKWLERKGLVKESTMIRAYKDVFGVEGNQTRNQKRVLADLMVFCGAFVIDHGGDQAAIIKTAGRREVLNLIQGKARYMNLNKLENDIIKLTEEEDDEY